jgi:hypothetical protein
MGRGRAKAKQTKVARDLKYSSPDWDPRKLENELRGNGHEPASESSDDTDASEYDDEYEDEEAPPHRR